MEHVSQNLHEDSLYNFKEEESVNTCFRNLKKISRAAQIQVEGSNRVLRRIGVSGPKIEDAMRELRFCITRRLKNCVIQ
jgi:hypothetical protein